MYLSIQPSIVNENSCYQSPTSVACDEPHGVTLRLLDGHKQGGRAGHHDGHVTGRAWELWVKHVEDRAEFKLSSDELCLIQTPATSAVIWLLNRCPHTDLTADTFMLVVKVINSEQQLSYCAQPPLNSKTVIMKQSGKKAGSALSRIGIRAKQRCLYGAIRVSAEGDIITEYKTWVWINGEMSWAGWSRET